MDRLADDLSCDFEYARPKSLADAVALLDEYGTDARLLAGGTDLIIGLHNRRIEPKLVIDLKRIHELGTAITERDGHISIPATTVLIDVAEDELVRRHFPALGESAAAVGSVQIRTRGTLAGNACNASPAADTVPPLLVYDATVVVHGLQGARRIAMDDFILGPGKTALTRGDLVTAIELPIPVEPIGTAFERLTRRRGSDIASVILCCSVDLSGTTQIAYGSVGPRALLVRDESGDLADPQLSDEQRSVLFDRVFSEASPDMNSTTASPEYRLAMLRVLGARALVAARDRLREELAR